MRYHFPFHVPLPRHITLAAAAAALALFFVIIVLSGNTEASRLALEFKGETEVVNQGYDPETYEFPFVVENRDQSNGANFSVFFDEAPPTQGGYIDPYHEINGETQNNSDPVTLYLEPKEDSDEAGYDLKLVVDIGAKTDATDYSDGTTDKWETGGYRFTFKLRDEGSGETTEYDELGIKVERRSGMRVEKPEVDTYEGDEITVGQQIIFDVGVSNLGNFKDHFNLEIEDSLDGELDDYWDVRLTTADDDTDEKDEYLELHSVTRRETARNGRFTVRLTLGENLGPNFTCEDRFTVTEGEHILTIRVVSNGRQATSLPDSDISDTIQITINLKWPPGNWTLDDDEEELRIFGFDGLQFLAGGSTILLVVLVMMWFLTRYEGGKPAVGMERITRANRMSREHLPQTPLAAARAGTVRHETGRGRAGRDQAGRDRVVGGRTGRGRAERNRTEGIALDFLQLSPPADNLKTAEMLNPVSADLFHPMPPAAMHGSFIANPVRNGTKHISNRYSNIRGARMHMRRGCRWSRGRR